MTEGLVYAVLFAIVSVLGLRGSIRLTLRYRAVRAELDERERPVLRSFAIVSWVITVACLYFGALSVRRLLGFEPIGGLAVASAVVAIVVLLVPAFLDYVVDRAARVPWPRR